MLWTVKQRRMQVSSIKPQVFRGTSQVVMDKPDSSFKLLGAFTCSAVHSYNGCVFHYEFSCLLVNCFFWYRRSQTME